MAQISNENGCKLDKQTSPSAVRPKRPVGKEEALHMEMEALAKLQREKTHALSTKPLRSIGTALTSRSQLEKDLIVFPESEFNKEADLVGIDVEKMTEKELENLLLDSDFGKNKLTRPSTLVYSKLSVSNPDGQAFSQSPISWNFSLSNPLNSNIPTPVHSQISAFPTTFSKPAYSFPNGFTPAQPPFIYQHTHQAPMLSFPTVSLARPLAFQQPVLNPEMAKLFDKIASTSEYLRNGRTSSLDADSVSDKSLEPMTHLSDLSSRGCFDWLDLDPLGKNQMEMEALPSALTGAVTIESVSAGDPWDAVLQKEPEISETCSSCSAALVNCKCSVTARASTGMAVTRTHDFTTSQDNKNKQVNTGSGDMLTNCATLQGLCAQNLEIIDFCEKVAKLRTDFAFDDLSSNRGYALSQVISLREGVADNSNSVKVSIEILGSQQPVTFTCDVSSPVELLIMQALCWVHDDLSLVEIDDYVLKVCGQEQVLQNKHSLGNHEYVQNCRKWEMEIKLQLLTNSTMRRDLARKEDDDTSPIDVDKYLGIVERPFKETVTRGNLIEQLERFHSHVTTCLQSGINTQHKSLDQLIQEVRHLCRLLGYVETAAITDAVMRLKHSVNLSRTHSPEGGRKPAISAHSSTSAILDHLTALTNAVYDFAKLYLCSFCSPSPDCMGQTDLKDQQDYIEASSNTDHLHFTLFALHGIPTTWISSYEKYYFMCSLTHNGRNLFKPVQSKKVGTFKSFFYHIRWDELIHFPISVASLPLETMLTLTLHGVLYQNVNNSPDSNKQQKGPELLGKTTMSLFDFRRVLMQGTKLLSFWMSSSTGVGEKRKNFVERLILQLIFPSTAVNILYVYPKEPSCFEPQSLEIPDPDIQKRIEKFCKQEFPFRVTRADKQLLWDWRHHCRKHEYSLPIILLSAPSWDLANIAEIHALLHKWPPLAPVSALELLDLKFADTEVRCMAVRWIKSCTDDDLIDYLPQLVQALKFECHLQNDLTMFLLSRAQGSVNIAHFLYWLLKDAVQEPEFAQRYSHVLGALLCLCGAGMRAELEKQSHLVQHFAILAQAVRQSTSSNRQIVLQEGLEKIQTFFKQGSCRLPLSPSLVAKELNIKACSFFTSNAVPLKLVLFNADPLGEEISVMFKVGEDLRQDMLALQMIRIMDRIWLQEGLDLRVVNFKCISTGKDKGIVELVPSSETLRKIQVEYGVTGSFKDKPLAEWLRKYNPAEDEYAKACENFIYSCAGCCVATYLLGICDRHNDNIMLRTTGHMFHIDFGKFLGHAQMIGSFKRDRTPFVLTSDMAYVINGGERPTSRFQLFVDLCSQAYNLIRKHSKLFLNLLSLMTHSGLPELTGAQDLKYVYDALLPQSTDAEATIFFTRLIESSLGSMATKFNFFIHNLAQLRFSGLPTNDEPILSFSPRTYTLKQDGRIRDASIFSFQKRYNPDKHYIYVVRILREGQNDPQFVFRTFDEFQELHNKLSIIFPLWKLPGFPNKMVLGRTHIKDVASKRKMELNSYVHSLMSSSAEVAQCDLIYTFFHPTARDDKTEGQPNVPEVPLSPITGCIGGEVKLSISYRNGTLFIMVMHIKDLVSDDGADPNPYVKTYLLPDPHKTSKRKTKVSRKTRNPTFNEMLVYSGYSKEILKQRELQLNVLSAESLRENWYLGGTTLSLHDFDLSQETVKWYKLTAGL